MDFGTQYIIERKFTHYDTKETMYRVKRIFKSGGIDYIVCTDEELSRIKGEIE